MTGYHRDYFQEDSCRDNVWREIAKYLDKFFPAKKSILELGAGYCSFINCVEAEKKTAVDIWSEFPRYAKGNVKCHIADVRGNISKLFKTKFDLILASNLLEHLTMDEAEDLLSECRILLSPKGRLVLIQPNFSYSFRHYFDDYTHKTIFTDESLRSILLNQQFKIVHEEHRFLPLTMKSRLPKWGILVRLYLSLPWRPFAGQMLVIASKFKAGP